MFVNIILLNGHHFLFVMLEKETSACVLGRDVDECDGSENNSMVMAATFSCIEEHMKCDPDSEKLQMLLHRVQKHVQLSRSAPESESHFVLLLECMKQTKNPMVVMYSLHVIFVWLGSCDLGEWMIKYNCVELFLGHLFPNFENQRIKLLILEIMSNLMSEGETAYSYCLESGAINLFLALFRDIESQDFEATDASFLTRLEVIVTGLIRPVLYPNLMDDALHAQLVTTYASILKRREHFGVVVKDTLNAAAELLTEWPDAHMFIETGLVEEIMAILSDEQSSFWRESFYFLGVALSHFEAFSFLAQPPNLCELCSQCCEDSCFGQFIDGFCFYLSCIFDRAPEHLPKLVFTGFFQKCLALVEEMPRTSQIEYIRMIMTVIEKGRREELERVLDHGHLVMIFDGMGTGDGDLIRRFLMIQDVVAKKMGRAWFEESGFAKLLLSLLEGVIVDDLLGDDVKGLGLALLESVS